MSNTLIHNTFYEKWKFTIDPVAFMGTSMMGFGKLRSFEWIGGPITKQSLALSGAINGLAIYLSSCIGSQDKNEVSRINGSKR